MPFAFEDFVLDVARRELRRGGDPVAIEPKVFDLLVHLVANRERVVTKDDLIGEVWDGRIVSESALTTAVNAARVVLGDSGGAQRLIKTLPRKGFRFVGHVREHEAAGTAATGVATAAPKALPDKPSIAVLPFTNLSGDKEQDYFSDGITEDIITELSRFSELFVIARNSSFTFKGKAVDVRQVSRELGVRYVLEGSIRRGGERVRISAQLIDALTGAHRWADRYDRELKDIFAVQEEVAHAIVAILAAHVNMAEIERAKRKPTENLGAYDIYLRGVANVHKGSREANEEALHLFYQAIKFDPEFPAPYAAAANCLCYRKGFGWIIDRDQEIGEVRRLARQVMQLGRSNATALSLVGYALAYVARELDDGVALNDRALVLNPNLAFSWGVSGWTRLWLGETDLAIEHLAHAMRLSPVDPTMFWLQEGTAHAHFFAGRYDEALAWAQMALRDLPDSHPALRIGAASNALAGRGEEAKRLMARLLEIDPTLRISNFLSNVLGPYRQPEHPAKYANALRKAGLPE